MKINKSQAQEIINKYVAGKTSRDLATEYSICQGSIVNIVSGRQHPELSRPHNIKEIAKDRMIKARPLNMRAWEVANRARHVVKYNSMPELTQNQISIITGSLLGDGYISSNICGERSFAKKQCIQYAEYIKWMYDKLIPYSCGIYKSHSTKKIINVNGNIGLATIPKTHCANVMHTINHPIFTKLRQEWYPEDVKIVPQKVVLSELAIAVWWMDDGSNDYSRRSGILATMNFSFDEVEFLSSVLLKLYGIIAKIHRVKSKKTDKPQPKLYFSGCNYDALINLIKPHITLDCFKYKTAFRKSSFLRDQERKQIVCKYFGGSKIGELSVEYSLTQGYIQEILSGKRGKHE